MLISRRFAVLLTTGALVFTACGSSDEGGSEPVASAVGTDDTLPTVDSSTAPATSNSPADSQPDQKDGGDPAPPTRRTTLDDVDLFDPSGSDDEFPRAAVPVDAYAADEVLVEPSDDEVAAASLLLETEGSLVIPVVVETCTLVAVWALPNPGELVVGYEEHPNIDCIRSVPRTALFTIPISGENSEGGWNFADDYEVTLERRVG